MKPRKLLRPTYPYSEKEARKASDEWGFNCGPAALATMLDLKPDDVRSAIPDFDKTGYTNPTMMWTALHSLGIEIDDVACSFAETWRVQGSLIGQSSQPGAAENFPLYGLARIQWEGPWTEPGAPPKWRYRQTHWVGSMQVGSGLMIFDVNGGWMPFDKWETTIVPALTSDIPRASGKWHVTHRWQLLFP